MYGLIGKIKANPNQRDALLDILLENAASMPGCLSYVAAKDPTDADAIWVTEVWGSQESHRNSLSLPSVQQAIARGRPLIAGFGEAAKLALRRHAEWAERCRAFRAAALKALAPLSPVFNGAQEHVLPHCVNLSFLDIPSDHAISALKPHIAVSSTSACTSHTRTPSHVLAAMGLPEDLIESSFRMSWCHLTPLPDWTAVVDTLKSLRHTR